MPFTSIPIRNIFRRLARSGLTAFGIGVAVAAFIALIGLSRGLENAWVNSLEERGTHIFAARKGAIEILTATMDSGIADEMLKIDGVSAVSGELLDLVSMEGNKTSLLTGWPMDSFLWNSLPLSDGRLPSATDENSVVIGEAASKAFDKNPGDTIILGGDEFIVIGIFKPGGVLNNNTIVVPLPLLQRITEREGKVTDFNIQVSQPDNSTEVAAVLERLGENFPELVFNETANVAQNNEVLGLLRAMAWSTSVIAFAIALVVVLNTLLMSVIERTREIGILSAVGWQPGRIISMILIEGLLLTIVGGIFGSILGIIALHWLSSFQRVQGFLEPQVTSGMIIEILAASLLLGILGSIYPALRAVRLNPLDALRYE